MKGLIHFLSPQYLNGPWMRVLGGTAIALLGLFLLIVVLPVRVPMVLSDSTALGALSKPDSTPDANAMENRTASFMRPELFRAPTRLKTKPKMDRTVEKVLAMLKLRCVTGLGSNPVAYISVKGSPMRSCREGDAVDDKFRVLAIHEKEVEIEIAGQKMTLGL